MTMNIVVQATALVAIAAAATWLAVAAHLMTFHPERALAMLRRTAASHRINITEQGLRMAAGIALVIRAPFAASPPCFAFVGWFIILSSAMLLVIPLRWHAAYAIWWADRVSLPAVRMIAPFSLAAGIALLVVSL